MNEDLREVFKLYKEQVDKLTYFIASISVACIGFCMFLMNDKLFSYSLLPLILSILLWTVSLTSSVCVIVYNINTTLTNLHYLDIKFESKDYNEIERKQALEATESIFKEFNDKLKVWVIVQYISFLFALFTFIIWRVIDMFF